MSRNSDPRTVLVVCSGDGTGLNFVRALRLTGGYRTIGVDTTLEDYHASETDVRYFVPAAESGRFIEKINELSRGESVDLIYAADTGPELSWISKHRDDLTARTLLPDRSDHLRTEDKWETFLALLRGGLTVPDTVLVRERRDLDSIRARHRSLWLRRRHGSGGSGSLATSSLDLAAAWVAEHDGWGHFTAAERLTSRTATFSGVWYDGDLVCSQLRERLSWKYSSLSPTGVTGVTGAQRTIWDESLHEAAIACVRAAAERPHGILGVDFTYGDDDIPRPTEVQPARFYSSIHFLATLGVNLPDLYCRLAFGEADPSVTAFNPIREHHYWLKAVDKLPRLLSAQEFANG